MATNYPVSYTDTDVPNIVVPGHKVNDTALDVTLFGRIRLEYGEKLNEDLLNILENFALPEAPDSTPENVRPLISQTSGTQLTHPTPGQFWFNTTRSQMFYWTGLEWRGLSSSNDTYAANWGQLTHGQQIPRPVGGVSGRVFDYQDCIWSVAPANVTGKFAVLNCTSDADAMVTMQYRYSGSATMLNGIANYLIIGIVGNDNAGSYSTAPNPSITPTRSPTPTPAVTNSPTPTVTPTIGSTPTPTPTSTRTPTPTAAATVTPSATVTPTPVESVTPTPTPTVTPSPSAPVLAKITNVFLEGVAVGVSVVRYQLNSDGINYLGTTVSGLVANETWRYAGASTDYEVRASILNGNIQSGSVTSAWLSLGTTQEWRVSSAGNNYVELLVEIRRTSDGVILTTASVELLATIEE